TLGGGVVITADPPLIPDLSALPGGPDSSINLGLTDFVIETHHLDAGFTSPIFQPIAYTATTAPTEEMMLEPKQGLIRSEHFTAIIRHSQFSKFDLQDEETINLRSGDIVVETTSRPAVVTTGKHSIRVAPKSVVLISKDKETIKVCPLYESGKTTVSYGTWNGHIFSGQELILAETDDALNNTLQTDGIGRRKSHSQPLPGVVLHRSEVSSISLIENNYILTKLVQSTDPKDKHLTDKLVKVAASLMSVTSSHGPYTAAPLR
ncbi:MAG: hypothetical protein K2X29_06780, partial [Candidatus Obscuribacterales bacterium]|nr:hypothetical protein [Candidatus Obscuribacterales bacterium]